MIRAKRPDRYVVDASVAIGYVWGEAHSVHSRRLFWAAERRWLQLIAPDLLQAECANGCWKRAQRGWRTADEVVRAMRVLEALPIVKMDSTELTDAALEIGLQTRISCYDALYVATAQFADVPLVTADMRLVQMLKEAAWEGRVFHLAEW